MSKQILISIFLNLLAYSNSKFFREETNYSKPKLERNNVLNKGLWIKDKVEKSNFGDFIFRADSADVDNLLQNNFDAFGDNFKDSVPIFSSYIERNKRSTLHKRNQRLRKSLKKCKEKINCLNDKTEVIKTKFLSKLQPASVFNDYPYEVALLLASSNKREISNLSKPDPKAETLEQTSELEKENNVSNQLNDQNKTDLNPLHKEEKITNETNVNIPKRRNSEIPSETIKIDLLDSVNDTQHIDGNKILRNVFEEEDRIWQSAPIQNLAYSGKRPENTIKYKPVTERGLVKIISLLTKTFRKLMKQHNEIQKIDSKLHRLNEDFMKNVDVMDHKFQNFDTKYDHVLKLEEELKFINDRLIKNAEQLERREIEMSRNLIEFEKQQKKFLAQQRQFYSIQKLMLEQNEKINYKQNLITKTQSEISHRQNNFARVLKKAKQLYVDTKYPNRSKLGPFSTKPKNISTKVEVTESIIVTTTIPTTTETMKISLFSIPRIAPLVNQDKLILNDKEDHLVDDLVFKYYFNNTFIANLMKSKVLTAIMNTESKGTRNAKNKRDKQISFDTTILLPVTNQKDVSKKLNRERRWIRHTKKVPRKFNVKPELLVKSKMGKGMMVDINVKQSVEEKNDPFLAMATNFCIEIKQNLNTQMLNWCIEKSLRRLKSIDMKTPMQYIVSLPVIEEPVKEEKHKDEGISSTVNTTEIAPQESTSATNQPPPTTFDSSDDEVTTESRIITEKSSSIFFPDNDELESNLKDFDLKPDHEGTVYYDGSLHTSDIVVSESDALSDIMPGLDSNSHVEVDPLALELQARRRAYVRRLNADIMKNMKM